MAPSGGVLSYFGRKKKQQEEPQTSNGLNLKPFRCLKQFCCIGKIPRSSEPIQDSANINEPSPSADNPALFIHPFSPEVVGNTADYPEIASLLAQIRRTPTQDSENNEASTSADNPAPAHLIHPHDAEIVDNTANSPILPNQRGDSENNEPSASADLNPAPAHLIHPYGREIVDNTANSPIILPNQRGFTRFTDPEIASLLASQVWRTLGENVPNELGIIRSTLFNFGSPMLRLFYMAGLVPPETDRGLRAGLYDANRVTWNARLRNVPPRGIGLDYEDFASHYGLSAQDYVYLLETSSPDKMMLVFMRRGSVTNSLAAWLVPFYEVGFPSFSGASICTKN